MTSSVRRAPVELAEEFVSAVMRQDFHDALVLCEALLMLEPQNETYLEFEKVLQEAKVKATIGIEPINNIGDNDIDNPDLIPDTDSDDYLTDSTDSSDDDSGNSHSSGSAFNDKNNNYDDTSDDDSSTDDSDDDSSDDGIDDFTPEQLAKLNLMVGGLKIRNS